MLSNTCVSIKMVGSLPWYAWFLSSVERMTEIISHSPEISTRPPSASQPSNVEEVKYSNVEKIKDSYQEEPEITPSNMHKVAAEVVGTYILIFIGCGSAFIDQKYNITLVGVALAWCFAVMALVYTLGHISGAHVNPAVTIAFATAGRFPWKQVPLYVVAQMLGSILASITLRWLFDGNPSVVMLTLPDKSTNDLNVVAWEIIITFILMFVISGAATDDRGIKELSGVAIGVTIFFNVLIAGKVSGASMNPARSLGPAFATKNFHKLLLYIVAPVIGAVAGSTVYNLLRLPENPTLKIVTSNFDKIDSQLEPTYSGKSMELP